MDLLARFQSDLLTAALLEPEQRVLVAFSGGADSTALLHLFCRLREPWQLEVMAAHLNHALRGEQSDADEQHCRNLCAQWEVPFFSRKVDVAQHARVRGISIEMAARDVRYAFLQDVAESVEADAIALGHTRDDHVETVLLNLIRGTGAAGLTGIPIRRDRYIRPLLSVSREQVRAYCAQYTLSYMEDLTNLDLRFGRNRIRLRVLPELRRVNPRVDEAIERLSQVMRAEELWWQRYLQRLQPEFTLRQESDCWVISSEWLRQQHPALQRRVLRGVAQKLSAEGAELQFAQVERLLVALREDRRAGVTVRGGNLHLAVDPKRVKVWLKPASVPPAYEIVVRVPGETFVPPAGVSLYAEYSLVPPAQQLRHNNWEVWCDAAQVGEPLVARNWRQGDRLQPMGLQGHRKLSDIFIDKRIPVTLRHRIPVVCDDKGIVWVVGVCIAHRVRCTDTTARTLHLRAEPLGRW